MKSQLGANGVKRDISSTGKSRNPGGNTDAALTGRRRTDGHAPHLALHTQETPLMVSVAKILNILPNMTSHIYWQFNRDPMAYLYDIPSEIGFSSLDCGASSWLSLQAEVRRGLAARELVTRYWSSTGSMLLGGTD